MKKDIDSKDIISEGTLHEILLDIKYRLDHLEDIEADNRALIVKMIKFSVNLGFIWNESEFIKLWEDFRKKHL